MYLEKQKNYQKISPIPNIITFPLLLPYQTQTKPKSSKIRKNWNFDSSPKITSDLKKMRIEPVAKRKVRSNENSPNRFFFEQGEIFEKNKYFRDYYFGGKRNEIRISEHTEKNEKNVLNDPLPPLKDNKQNFKRYRDIEKNKEKEKNFENEIKVVPYYKKQNFSNLRRQKDDVSVVGSSDYKCWSIKSSLSFKKEDSTNE